MKRCGDNLREPRRAMGLRLYRGKHRVGIKTQLRLRRWLQLPTRAKTLHHTLAQLRARGRVKWRPVIRPKLDIRERLRLLRR